jgi:hypothetical protein
VALAVDRAIFANRNIPYAVPSSSSYIDRVPMELGKVEAAGNSSALPFNRYGKTSGAKKNSVICYKCRKPGHFAKDCPEKKQKSGGNHGQEK